MLLTGREFVAFKWTASTKFTTITTAEEMQGDQNNSLLQYFPQETGICKENLLMA